MWFQDNFIEMIALQTDHGASSPKTGKIKTCSYFYVPLKALKVIKLEVVNIIVTIMRWRKDKCSMFQIFQPDKLQLVLFWFQNSISWKSGWHKVLHTQNSNEWLEDVWPQSFSRYFAQRTFSHQTFPHRTFSDHFFSNK